MPRYSASWQPARQRNIGRFIVGILLVNLLAVAAAEGREWTDSTGKSKTEAEYFELFERQVLLKRPDGRVVAVPLARLSVDDQLFAMEESKRRAIDIPKLNAAGQRATEELLDALRMAAAAYQNVAVLDYDQLAAATEKARPIVIAKLPRIISSDGRQSSVVPAIIAMLEDKNPVVRAVGMMAIVQMGASASAAGPALARLLPENSEPLRNAAYNALETLFQHTDTPLVGLLPLLVGEDDEAGEAALRSLRSGVPDGPRVAEALPLLVKLALDEQHAINARVRAVQTLESLLRYQGQHRRPGDWIENDSTPMTMERLQAIRDAQEKQRRQRNLRYVAVLAPLLEQPGDVRLQQPVVSLLAAQMPEQLAKAPTATLLALLTHPPVDDFDLREYQRSLRQQLIELIHDNQLSLDLSPVQIADLLRKDDENSDLRSLAHLLMRKAGRRSREALPTLAKMVAGEDEEISAAAIHLLTGGSFTDNDDLSELPAFPVLIEADAAGKVRSIMVAGKPQAGMLELRQAIRGYQPPAPAASTLTVEQILSQAARGDNDYVSRIAIDGLEEVHSSAAKEILRDISTTAVRRELREQAAAALRNSEVDRHGNGEFPAVVIEQESPFGDNSPVQAERREFAVALKVTGPLRVEHLSELLAAIEAPALRGIRLVPAMEQPAVREIQLQRVDSARQRVNQSQFHVQLSAPQEERGAGIRLGQPNENQTLRAPSFDALQFALTYVVRQQYERGSFHARHYRRGDLGASALPIAATISCEAGVPMDRVTQALIAISSTDKQPDIGPNLVQWIRLTLADQPPDVWFVQSILRD